jgi:hypothetical protein
MNIERYNTTNYTERSSYKKAVLSRSDSIHTESTQGPKTLTFAYKKIATLANSKTYKYKFSIEVCISEYLRAIGRKYIWISDFLVHGFIFARR